MFAGFDNLEECYKHFKEFILDFIKPGLPDRWQRKEVECHWPILQSGTIQFKITVDNATIVFVGMYADGSAGIRFDCDPDSYDIFHEYHCTTGLASSWKDAFDQIRIKYGNYILKHVAKLSKN